MRLREDSELAYNKATYVDDINVAGHVVGDVNLTQRASKRLKSRMNYYGNQAGNMKYRPATTTLGPWNGGILHTDTLFPMKSTTRKKWGKFREELQWIL